MAKLLFCSRDAGGTRALIPVIRAAQAARHELDVWGYKFAPTILSQAGISHSELGATALEPSALRNLLVSRRPDALIVSSTNVAEQDSVECRLVEAGKSCGIPSVSVLDHWCDIAGRYGARGSEDRARFLPDRIAVMDELARDMALDVGLREPVVTITGQPRFDEIVDLAGRITERERAAVRRALPVPAGEPFILFASEPMLGDFGDRGSPRYYGFTQFDILRAVLEAAGAIARRRQTTIHIAVRLHPKETDLDGFRAMLPPRGVKMIVQPDIEPLKAAASADVVVGMVSIFLVEAALLGRPSFSVQIGSSRPEELASNRTGLTRRIDDPLALRRDLEAALFDARYRELWSAERRRIGLAPRGAAQRILDTVFELIDRKGGLSVPRQSLAKPSTTRDAYLTGETIYLRGLRREDAGGNWRHWFDDQEVTRYMRNGSKPSSAEELAAFYERVVASEHDVVFAIIDKKSGSHIGNVGLHGIDWVDRKAEFGIVLGEKLFWSQGRATEATRLIVDYAFRRLNLNKVRLGVHEGNAAAIRAYEKAGFTAEATLREEIYRDGAYHGSVYMSVLAREFWARDQNGKK